MRRFAILPLVACCGFGAAADAAEIHVTTTADAYGLDGLCALREAISSANLDRPPFPGAGECAAGSGADVVVVPAGYYALSRAGVAEDDNLTGDLDIRGAVELRGAGIEATIISGEFRDRVFSVSPFSVGKVLFSGMSIIGGLAPTRASGDTDSGAGGGIQVIGANVELQRVRVAFNGVNPQTADGLFGGCGGGIVALYGSLSIVDSELSNNVAADQVGGGLRRGGDGGAICSLVTPLEIIRTRFSRNRAGRGLAGFPDGAGGALLQLRSFVSVSDSVLVENEAGESTGLGGAIAAFETRIAVDRSTLAANRAAHGGAVHGDEAEIRISDSTLAGNSARNGGAVHLRGHAERLFLDGATLVDNRADVGAAIELLGCITLGCAVRLRSSVLQHDPGAGGGACALGAAIASASGGFNALPPDASCGPATATDIVAAAGMLSAARTDSMGRRYHEPVNGSPLVDAGHCDARRFDQLGRPRPQQQQAPDAADGCDIGAVELPADRLFDAGFE